MLIQIEGNEASGKTTLINKLVRHYQNLNCSDFHLPTLSTPFGVEARKILTNKLYADNHKINREIIITLLAYLDQYVLNANRDSSRLIIQSRGILSNLVYANLSSNTMDKFTEQVLGLIKLLPKPDLIIYLNPPISELESRLINRNIQNPKEVNIYDQVHLLNSIHERYLLCTPYLTEYNIKEINHTEPDLIFFLATTYIDNLLCNLPNSITE